MAAVLGDLLQVTDFQTYLGEELLNVYYYRVTQVTGFTNDGYEAIAEWFEDEVIAEVRALQNDALVHTGIEVRNLTNNIDFFELPLALNGTEVVASTLVMPSYVTAGFQLIRESLVTRNGYKRFSGLVETRVTGNTYGIDSGVRAAIESALAQDIVIGAVTFAEPVIVKRPFTPPVTQPYPYASIGSAQYKGMGTQNTRKP